MTATGRPIAGSMAGKAVMLAALATLGACASTPATSAPEPQRESGLFGIFGGSTTQAPAAEIGVNSYLWRASLDTISFMPLENADQIGGVITTDWWADPSMPSEWMKVQVFILDTRLRGDGLRVQVFRRTGPTAAAAQAAPVDPDTAIQLENAILTRARLLRLQTVGG